MGGVDGGRVGLNEMKHYTFVTREIGQMPIKGIDP